MRSLPIPRHDPVGTFRACVAEVTNSALARHYSDNEAHLKAQFDQFSNHCATSSWYKLPISKRGEPDQVVTGSLTKGQLVSLYGDYMVSKKGDSRDIYDDILISSNDICPFCAGLGQVKTLDHFLPKSRYPSFSILPANLFPCCRDCNYDKRASVPDQATEVSVNPYFDASHFFGERWVVADLVRSSPLTLTYRACPPAHWAALDQARAICHFESYGLGKRFSIQASGELGRVVAARKGELHILPPANYKNHLLDQAKTEDLDLNGWSRTMYQALADSAWFVTKDFRLP